MKPEKFALPDVGELISSLGQLSTGTGGWGGHSLLYKCPSAGVTQRAPLLQICPRSPGSEAGVPAGLA